MRISDWSSDVCSSDLVDQRGVGAVHHRGITVGKQPVLGQVQHQQRAHAVIGEALPHLGEEQHVKATRVAEKRLFVSGRSWCGYHGSDLPRLVPEISDRHITARKMGERFTRWVASASNDKALAALQPIGIAHVWTTITNAHL